ADHGDDAHGPHVSREHRRSPSPHSRLLGDRCRFGHDAGMPVRTFVLGLRNYQLLLRLDGVGRMVAMGIIARLPIGMLALSLVLLVRSLGGPYGEAGFASAANSVAAALAAPIAGRLVDRYSPHRVLMACGIIHPCTLGVLLLLAWLDAPMWAIIVAAFVTG